MSEEIVLTVGVAETRTSSRVATPTVAAQAVPVAALTTSVNLSGALTISASSEAH